MAKVTLNNVSKVYENGFEAVKNINLEIYNKEFMVLVGPSGCGKSTTLRMIAGLEEANNGEIKIGEKVVNNVLPKDRDIAFVFQNYALYPHMTVFENMAFGLKLRKVKKAEIKERVEATAAVLGLSEVLNRRPKQLSGGQRQRVAVGRAIVRDPKVFLFDEPLSNLDAKMRVQMRAEISKLHSSLKSTMVYVTHDQTEAMTMGDRICVMNHGVIQQLATPLELYDYPNNLFVAGFIGTPAMNFFEGVIFEDKDYAQFVGDGIKIDLNDTQKQQLSAYNGRAVIMGIRSEFIQIADVKTNSGQHNNAIVEVIEPMGSETYLYLKINSHSFVAKVEAHNKVVVGQNLALILNAEKMHFFDKETELAIR
ncbi:sn-glycerol-3-phosphate ABC transporter ATP-binding protein UgpC [Lentisphaerota bacterium WC36G]|nr:sn-glycerol-3-phosphate ABC transporter ATP-binding protein UgpC [Lentisphaerae bacterium WC36]